MNDLTAVTKAYALAAVWHCGQPRKGKAREPYINHLTEVAELVTAATAGRDPDLTIAAILHDAIEDAQISAQQIEAPFGAEVARLVCEVTDDKSLPKHERKRRQVETTPHKSDRAKALKLADKTSNLRDLLNSPPPWPLERKRAYLDWARQVAAGARGVNDELEAAFDEAAMRLEEALATEKA